MGESLCSPGAAGYTETVVEIVEAAVSGAEKSLRTAAGEFLIALKIVEAIGSQFPSAECSVAGWLNRSSNTVERSPERNL